MEQILKEMLQVLLEGQPANVRDAKMELIHMLSRISDYGIRCGISRKYMKKCSETAVAQILSCSFIADARTYFMEFFDIFTEGLKEVQAGEDISFRLPVSEYIEMHYMENISWEIWRK